MKINEGITLKTGLPLKPSSDEKIVQLYRADPGNHINLKLEELLPEVHYSMCLSSLLERSYRCVGHNAGNILPSQ